MFVSLKIASGKVGCSKCVAINACGLQYTQEKTPGIDIRTFPTTVSMFNISSWLLFFFLYFSGLTEKKQERQKMIGKARIGGSFELVDIEGKTVSSESLRGTWLLLYFGFTHCPDVCPDQLDKLSSAIDQLRKTSSLWCAFYVDLLYWN